MAYRSADTPPRFSAQRYKPHRRQSGPDAMAPNKRQERLNRELCRRTDALCRETRREVSQML
jgi:hypothetical protein